MLQQFTAFFKQHGLLQPGTPFIAAVSGGIDSVVLCELCHQAGFPFLIAHCNFQLRGAESERDEAFVRSLGERYGVTVFVQRFDTAAYANAHQQSIQEAARHLRYEWFEQLRVAQKAAYTLLAHHANDNVETLVMHFFRGTGLQGLTGIPTFTTHVKCVRPLLPFTRKEIEHFAQQQALSWVEDSSNSSTKYTRNFFRNDVLPMVKKVYPQAEENLLDNLARFQKINRFYSHAVHELKAKMIETEKGEQRIPVRKLMKYADSSFLYEVIKDFGFSEKGVPELIKLSQSESGKFIESEHYRIIRHRKWFLIASKKEAPAATAIIEKENKKIHLPGAVLDIATIDAPHVTLNRSKHVAQLDARALTFPLLIRRWKEGDYFYPLGMRKKKKLARFFIDQKLSATEKESVWVVESAGRICWVVGHRIDERFKLTDATTQVVQLTLSSP